MAKILTLSDLAPRVVEYRITPPGGGEADELIVPIRTLTDQDVENIRKSCPDPAVPKKSSFNSQTKKYEQVEDRDDPVYKEALRVHQSEFAYRIVAAALAIDLDGKDLAEKAENLRKNGMAEWAFLAIIDRVYAATGFDVASAITRSESFR